MKLILALLVGYATLVVAACMLQRQMLYYPALNAPSEAQLQTVGLRFWPVADAYRGFVARETQDFAHATVVVFHGNAGAAWQREYYVKALQPRGYRVLLVEYPGYGGRPGTPSEKSLVAEARETLRRAHEQFGGPLIVWGESLGCGVAAALAADRSLPVSGVVMLTPWDNLPRMAQSAYWFLPARLLVQDKYDNSANLREFNGPVAVLVAEQDAVIPVAHSMTLYQSLAEPKKLWTFPGAGHNSWPVAADEAWWGEVMTFVNQS